MNVKLVGLSFVETYPANIDALEDQGPGAVVVLRREPDNERDPNAVQVVHVTDDGEAVMLGHVPAGLAGRLAPEMDAGADWKIAEARVLRTTGAYSDRPGLAVDIERRGE